jgi:hypothetical protein
MAWIATTVLFLLAWACITYAKAPQNQQAPTFTVGPTETVLTARQAKAADLKLADAGVYALNDNGTLKWFGVGGPPGANKMYRSQIYSIGPRDNPYEKIVSRFVHIEDAPERQLAKGSHGTGFWIANVYRNPANGHILAFVHTEYSPFRRPETIEGGWYCRFGLAISKDGGESFRWCGYFLTPDLSYESLLNHWYGKQPWHCNMGLACYVVNDGYINVYYQDTEDLPDRWVRGVAVARARVKDVLDSADKGRVTVWKKYYQGQWSEEGIGGRFTPLGIEPKGYMHGDGAYNTYLGQYVLVTRDDEGRKGCALVISFSSDGIHWSPWQDLRRDDDLYNHPSIVSAGDDNETVGKSFWVYYKYKPQRGERSVERVLVTLD